MLGGMGVTGILTKVISNIRRIFRWTLVFLHNLLELSKTVRKSQACSQVFGLLVGRWSKEKPRTVIPNDQPIIEVCEEEERE